MSFAADEGTAAHKVFEWCMLKPKYTADRFVGKVIDTSSERTHAPFAPSASSRWIQCPASVQHIEANTKTAGHQDGAKIEVTEGMAEAVQMAVDYVREVVGGQHATMYVEAEVEIDCISAYGHVDVAAYITTTKHLHVFDYKHGVSPVEAKNNSQAMLYALGLIAYITANGKAVKSVTLHIAQPRVKGKKLAPCHSWDVSLKALDVFENTVREAVRIAKHKAPPYKVGDHCYFCAKETCPEHVKKSLEVAKQDFEQFTTKPLPKKKHNLRVLNNKELAQMMDNLHILMGFVAALPEEVKRRIELGQTVKGWGIGPGRSAREFKPSVYTALEKMNFDIDEYQPRTLLGIGAIEKMIPAPKREAFMAKHTLVRAGKPSLQPTSKIHSSAEEDFQDLM